MTATQKELLKREFSKAWSTEKMADYCTKRTADYAELPNGGLVTIEKQHIKTRFCFGESGYDFDEAVKSAETARKSADYFKTENMAYFAEWLHDLKAARRRNSNYALFIHNIDYYGQTPDCLLRAITFERVTDVIDAFGGSCVFADIAGQNTKINGCYGHIASDTEYKIIIDAYERAAAEHEKKINTYLKRFGLSNVVAWTYWREA